jgi:tRNA (mo5U34)-methyltransferase
MSAPFLKSLARLIPRVREHLAVVDALRAERDRLASQLAALSAALSAEPAPRGDERTAATPVADDWSAPKRRKQEISAAFRESAATARLTHRVEPLAGATARPFAEVVRHQVEAEHYWFQRLEVLPGLFSPGWSDPAREKLPYYGLPDDLTGKRVLDIGCAEGFFSFEAERRGAREVIGIDSFPESIRRFNLVKAARQSNASAFLMNVYDLEPRRLGTFDLVLFYGVFYHLKHPQLALERIRTVCTGDLLFQTYMLEEPSVKGTPWARYFPHGMMSGAAGEHFDPTVFWLFNSACCLAMLDYVGFVDAEILSTDPHPFVVRARSPQVAAGCPPDQTDSPWS